MGLFHVTINKAKHGLRHNSRLNCTEDRASAHFCPAIFIRSPPFSYASPAILTRSPVILIHFSRIVELSQFYEEPFVSDLVNFRLIIELSQFYGFGTFQNSNIPTCLNM